MHIIKCEIYKSRLPISDGYIMISIYIKHYIYIYIYKTLFNTYKLLSAFITDHLFFTWYTTNDIKTTILFLKSILFYHFLIRRRGSHFVWTLFKLNVILVYSSCIRWLVEISYQRNFEDIEPIDVEVDHQRYSENHICLLQFCRWLMFTRKTIYFNK